VPGPDTQFFEEDRTSKTSKCLLRHPQWPVIFYKALDHSKKLKNADFTAYIVFYLTVGSGTGYPIFWRRPDLKNWSMLVETSTVTGYFLQGSRPVKNIRKSGVYSPCSILPNSRCQDQIPNFLKKTSPQKPVNACWDIHSDRSFFTRLLTGQKN